MNWERSKGKTYRKERTKSVIITKYSRVKKINISVIIIIII
jgi:hypothetical protein